MMWNLWMRILLVLVVFTGLSKSKYHILCWGDYACTPSKYDLNLLQAFFMNAGTTICGNHPELQEAIPYTKVKTHVELLEILFQKDPETYVRERYNVTDTSHLIIAVVKPTYNVLNVNASIFLPYERYIL